MVRTKKRSWGFYLLMISPALFLLSVVIIYPIFRSLFLSFTEFNAFQADNIKFVGLDNYLRMFKDPIFWRAFNNNMFVVAISVFCQIPIAIALAYLIHRSSIKGRHFFQAMVFLPQVISTIVVGILWKWMVINPNGVVSYFLQQISGDPNKIFGLSSQLSTAMYPIGFALIWIYTGFYMLIFLASLQKLDYEIFEAAMIDGAQEWRVFFNIVLPALSGAIVVNAILAISGSLKGFDLIWAMTEGGPADYTTVLPIYMYKYAFQSKSIDAYSFGSAVSMVIVAISIIMIVITQLISKKVGDKSNG